VTDVEQNTGVFQGLPPTGRKVAFEGLELNRHGDDGRVAEHWFQRRKR